MIIAANKSPHLGNARQMRGVETADGATSDDADFFHRSAVVSPTNCQLR